VLSAHVLIQTVGRQGRAGAQRPGCVPLAEDLAGPYDVIARVQAPGLDQLGRLVVSRIQVVDGVTRTLICTAIHRYTRDSPRRPALCLVELRGLNP
jgi:DNA-binding Lrp family transcriptional regulator